MPLIFVPVFTPPISYFAAARGFTLPARETTDCESISRVTRSGAVWASTRAQPGNRKIRATVAKGGIIRLRTVSHFLLRRFDYEHTIQTKFFQVLLTRKRNDL